MILGQLGKGPLFSETTWWGTYSPSGAWMFYHKDAQGNIHSFAIADADFLSNKEYQKAKRGKKNALGTTYHLKFSMPAFYPRPTKSHSFKVKAHPNSSRAKQEGELFEGPKSIVLTNYDKLAEQNLQDQRTETVIRTVLRVLIRTTSTHATKKKLQTSNPLLNFITNLGVDFLSDELEKADTRNSFVLPKTVQLSYLEVPAGTYNVQVHVLNKRGVVMKSQTIPDLSVSSGETQFVFVNSLE